MIVIKVPEKKASGISGGLLVSDLLRLCLIEDQLRVFALGAAHKG